MSTDLEPLASPVVFGALSAATGAVNATSVCRPAIQAGTHQR
jgi:hypothetical protein